MAQHDIFISFSSKDEVVARRVVAFLEENQFVCWISLRDVEPGQNYQESIVAAIEAAKVMIFLFSENSNQSGEIKKELSLAGAANVVVIPLRLSPVMPSGALRYELATRQWVDAFPNLENAFGKLLSAVKDTMRPPSATPVASESSSGGLSEKQRSPGRAAPEPIVRPGSETFEAIRGLLARHIGPIAKILVQHAATEASSADDFCERLASSIKNPSERDAFLHAVRSRLGVMS